MGGNVVTAEEEESERPSPHHHQRPSTLLPPGTPDPFASWTGGGGGACGTTPTPDLDDIEEEGSIQQPRHLLDLFGDCGSSSRASAAEAMRLSEILWQSVTEELDKSGIRYDYVRPKAKVRKSPRSKDTPKKEGAAASLRLQRLVEVELPAYSRKVSIPFAIKTCCDFILARIKEQGIFRLSGSILRANAIIQRLANPETKECFLERDSVHDVAYVLKQYVRGDLDDPLIPYHLHSIFRQCLSLPEDTAASSLLLVTCLLPKEKVGLLLYLLQFLAEVAEANEANLMDYENLAIVMGPNIMPIDPRKKEKSTQIETGYTIHQHNKIIEILIRNAKHIARLTPEVEKKLDSQLIVRSSEDELENEGVGRRKKRRSGMFGFLKKVTGGKTGAETPSTPLPKTPGGDGLATPGINWKAKLPEGSFNPFDWIRSGNTPKGNRLRNLVTPGFRKRNKSADNIDSNTFSAPTRPLLRLRFGRTKAPKVQATATPSSEANFKTPENPLASTMTINNLPSSPRAGTLRRRPSASEKPSLPPKPKNVSSSTVYQEKNFEFSSLTQTETEVPLQIDTNNDKNDDGDYVLITSDALLHGPDLRNDAFISSSSKLSVLTADEDNDQESASTIREINYLARVTANLSLSTPKEERKLSKQQVKNHERRTESESPEELNATSRNVNMVDQKFKKAIHETKLAKIQRENIKEPLQRRLSVQDKTRKMTMSPSQRRIVSNVRRKSHEIARVTPTVTPSRFLSLRSPRNDEAVSSSTQSLKRSPTRCTLKRGRPNTKRAGLAARPGQGSAGNVVENEPACSSSKGNNLNEARLAKENAERVTIIDIPPIRRLSSVKHLVDKLEEKANKNSNANEEHKPKTRSRSSLTLAVEASYNAVSHESHRRVSGGRSRMSESPAAKIEQDIRLITPTNNANKGEITWVTADKFTFDKDVPTPPVHVLQKPNKKGKDRDSIYLLKTVHAGKVPSTVEFFNKIGHNKSPTKSLIPRYTALHNKSPNANDTENAELLCMASLKSALPTTNSTPSRLTRRLSSVDIGCRNKKEELLEKIKKESSTIKRSNTTVGTCQASKDGSRPSVIRGNYVRRPNSLDLTSKTPTSKAPRTPYLNAQTPQILEEEEETPPTVPSSNAKHNVGLDRKCSKKGGNEFVYENMHCSTAKSYKSIVTSPLKTSNIANAILTREELSTKRSSPTASKKVVGNNGNAKSSAITRTNSEKGTTSTARTTNRNNSKIKKSLTTRSYDLSCSHNKRTLQSSAKSVESAQPQVSTASSTSEQAASTSAPSTKHSRAHGCQTITPLRRSGRRVPKMGNAMGVSLPPAISETPNLMSILRTPGSRRTLYSPPR